ncbi:retrovirus-related pol polyprotein from transposon TNT 1-94, partial [Tanacetum coccineum]
MSKAKRSSFKTKAVPSSKGRLNLLHMDLCGPMRVASINGKKYILVIVDDYSRYTWTLFLRSKDETPEVLKDFLTMIQRNLQAQVITVRTDRGTEFLNKTLNAYFKEEGIEHQTSTPRTPEQNGVVERRNRTLVEAARTMLSASKLPLSFWAEAVATAYLLVNTPYNDVTFEDLKSKHPFKPAPSLPHIPINHHPLIASPAVVLDRIKSFPRGTSCGWDVLRAPLTLLVKMGGNIRSIAVGTIWRRLVSKVGVVMIGHSLDGYLDDLQFGVGVSGRGEAILHSVNRLIEDHRDDVGLSMLLVDFKNGFNLVDRELDCITGTTSYGHAKGCNRAWYLDDGTIVGDTLVVGKVLELIMEDGPRCGLHLNVDKTE